MRNPLSRVDPFEALLVRRTLPKVPLPVAPSWLAAVLVTGLGAGAAGALGRAWWGPGASLPLVAAALVAALGLQLSADRYAPPLHWATLGLLSALDASAAHLAGARAAAPEAVLVLAAALAAALAAWWAREGTLSLEAVTTTSREVSYWTVALLAVALGTCATGWLRTSAGAGHWRATLLIGAVVAAVVLSRRRGLMRPVAAHWALVALAAPLGALLRQDLALPRAEAGLGLGAVWTGAGALVGAVAVVTYLTLYRSDEAPLVVALPDAEAHPHPHAPPHRRPHEHDGGRWTP